jgi:hypothetical protein
MCMLHSAGSFMGALYIQQTSTLKLAMPAACHDISGIDSQPAFAVCLLTTWCCWHRRC